MHAKLTAYCNQKIMYADSPYTYIFACVLLSVRYQVKISAQFCSSGS